MENRSLDEIQKDNHVALRIQKEDGEKKVKWGAQKNTDLHKAAKSGNLDEAKEILRLDSWPLHEKNIKGDTALHMAAKLGNLQIAKYLVGFASNKLQILRMVNLEGNTALHEAVRHNHFEVVEFLVDEDKDSTCLINGDGDSPLFMAVDRCFYKVAFHILNTCAATAPDPFFAGRNGMNVLHVAVIRARARNKTFTVEEALSLILGKKFTIAELLLILLNLFISIQELIYSQKSLLPLDNQKADFVCKLVDEHQSLTLKKDDFGWSPFHYAAYLGNAKIVKLFMKQNYYKSFAYTRNIEGLSALHISAKNGHVDVVRTLMTTCPEICELLDDKNRTALHFAVESREASVLKCFLEAREFQDLINDKDNRGNTALHLASTQGIFEILKLLVNDSKVDKGATNEEGKTFVDIILSNKKLKDIDILEIMMKLGIETGIPIMQAKEKNGNEEQRNRSEIQKDDQQVEEKRGNEEQRNISAEKKLLQIQDPELNQAVQGFANINLVIATIIATASFAAAFTMPGGYNDDGVAILEGRKEFESFLFYDSMAFVCSTASMLIHFIVPLFGKVVNPLYPITWITILTGLSLGAMIFAFDKGVRAVFPQHSKLASGNPYLIQTTFCSIIILFVITLLVIYPLLRRFRKLGPHDNVRNRFRPWS